ncbi:MAG: hypothetical protein H0W88_10925 [Parachlamydiaceae bacterium]|nr:hypothetical protein [Parachlamydiaceae bacterium]
MAITPSAVFLHARETLLYGFAGYGASAFSENSDQQNKASAIVGAIYSVAQFLMPKLALMAYAASPSVYFTAKFALLALDAITILALRRLELIGNQGTLAFSNYAIIRFAIL